MIRTRLICALAATLTLAACRPAGPKSETVAGVTPSRYADAMVALRRLATETHSTAEFQARKAETLARLHVTEPQLQEFARAHAGDVALMSAIWDTVEARLGRAAPRDSAAGRP